MKKTDYIVLAAICFGSLFPDQLIARGYSDSVQWIKGMTWAEIKQKAKQENKYIFVDAFATWCGPCKMMDKQTFPDEKVVEVLNSRFIPVKVQMDVTKDDDPQVKKWYSDAAAIRKEYLINAYPTYIYLSPKGEVTHIIKGFKDAKRLLKETDSALLPGRKYVDPYAEFHELQEAYNNGKKDYSKMPFLFKTANKIGRVEDDFAKTISKEYREYLSSLKENKWYTKDNIEFLTAHALKSSSPFFRMFYPDGDKVDKIMQQKGFAESYADKIIFGEITQPFLSIKTGGPVVMTRNEDGQVPAEGEKNSAEADWDGLKILLLKSYDERTAKRNLSDGKLFWYDSRRNKEKFREELLLGLKEFGFDVSNKVNKRSLRSVNAAAWDVFGTSTDVSLLNSFGEWMKKVVDLTGSEMGDYPVFVDTYANILYKLGNKEEAIKLEEKAVQILKNRNSVYYTADYEKVLSKMKAGIPTWKTQ